MKLKDFLSVCLVLALTLSIAGAENRKRTRHYLHSSRSNAPDSFVHQVPATRGSHRTPSRPTRIPMAKIGFKTAHSKQQLTSDASPDMRPYPDTEDYSSEEDYPEIDYHEMNWGRNQDYDEERPVIESRPSASFKHITDNSVRRNRRLEQYQRERNYISQKNSRMWPTHVVCHCETNLGGVYGLSNEIPTESFSPYPRPYAQEYSAYGQPQIHHGSESRPHYSLRTKPSGWNSGENDYNHINFRGSTFEDTEASKFNKSTIRPKFTTANPISVNSTTPTKDESPDALIRIIA